jgi:phenylacetic acid degradation operon negative regulatory protein
MTDLTARRLVLNMITSRPTKTFSIATLCRGGAMVGISDANVRMATMRLAKEGVLQRAARGTYRFQPENLATYEHVRHWRTRLDLVGSWSGDWLVVDTSLVDRTSRSTVRRLEREIALIGLVPWRGQLHIRPNNLVDGLSHLRSRLSKGATAFLATQLADDEFANLTRSWDTGHRHGIQRTMIAELHQSLEGASAQAPQEFARDSMRLGSQAIGVVLRDPLLPDELDSKAALHELMLVTRDYQDAAQRVWAEILWNEPFVDPGCSATPADA